MTTNRVLIGKRGSDLGMWCSKPGFDVKTTGPENMIFDMGSRSEQILQQGFAAPGATIALGYSAAPAILVCDIANASGAAVAMRPFPNLSYPNRYTYAPVTPDYFQIIPASATPYAPGYIAERVGYLYFVYRRAF